MPEYPNVPNTEFQELPEQENFFRELYANNIFYEPSGWDMKLVFGQLDQRRKPGKAVVHQHTAITIPWQQAKLLLYFLRGHLEFHEKVNGAVKVPPGAIPSVPPPTEEMKKQDPNVEAAYHIFLKLRNELLEEQKK